MAPQACWSPPTVSKITIPYQDDRLGDSASSSRYTIAAPEMTDAKPTAADLNRRIDQCAARQADMKSRITKLGPTAGKTESDKAALEAISKLGSTSLVSSDADMSTVSRDMSDADIADMSSKIDSVEFEVHRLEGFLTDMESEWEKSEDLFRSGPNPPGHADDGVWGEDGTN